MSWVKRGSHKPANIASSSLTFFTTYEILYKGFSIKKTVNYDHGDNFKKCEMN